MDGMACERPVIQVRAFLSESAADLGLRLRAGAAGLDREIFLPRIQKPGLALAAGGFRAFHRGSLCRRRWCFRHRAEFGNNGFCVNQLVL